MFSSVQIFERQMFLLVSRLDRIANALLIDNTLAAGATQLRITENTLGCRSAGTAVCEKPEKAQRCDNRTGF